MHPKISIIIPAYNCAKYVCKAINSAINQTYKNIEIIVVNDGSNDNETEKILLSFNQKIKYIYKENEGVSLARNKGIEASSGEYIMFLDADDWIDETMCETLVRTATQFSCDMVICDYMREFKSLSKPKHTFSSDLVFEREEVRKLHRRLVGQLDAELKDITKFDSLASCWAKLYKSEIIKCNNISFYDIRKIGTFEDGIFNIEYLYHINKVAYVNQPLYHYRKTNDSSVTAVYKSDLVKKHEHIHSFLNEYISKYNLNAEYVLALQSRIAHSLIGYGLNILKSKDKQYGKLKEILVSEYYQKAYWTIKIRYLSPHWMVFYLFARIKFTAGVYLMLKAMTYLIGR